MSTTKKKRRILPVILLIMIAACLLLVAAGAIGEYIQKRLYPVGYSEIVQKYSAEYDVPEQIIYAVIRTESSFRAEVVSNAGAVGLMQIMPDTFEWLMTKTGEKLETDTLSYPDVNIKYGVFFLSYLYNEFSDWELVYAAYNAGMNRVRGWLADENYSDGTKLMNIPIKETAAYVVKVRRAREIYEKLY